MTQRRIPALALLVGLLGLSDGVAFAAGEKFEITSVTYTDANGVQQTNNFNGMNIAQIPAVAVQSDVIVNGTYGPANGVVASTIAVDLLGAELATAPANCNNGNRTMTIAKNTLSSNTVYKIASSRGDLPSTASVDGADVCVTNRTLAIAIN